MSSTHLEESPAPDEDLVHASLLKDGEVHGLSPSTGAPQGRLRKAAALVMTVFAVWAVVFKAVPSPCPQASAPSHAQVGASIGLAGFFDILSSTAKAMGTVKKTSDDMESSFKTLANELEKEQKDAYNYTTPKDIKAGLEKLKGKGLEPKNEMHDGNLCPDSEEEFAGTCYKKCADLTDGKLKYRASPFGCCLDAPCSIYNTKSTSMFSPCEGFNVAGKFSGLGRGTVCPHLLGDCLLNEELLLGICYKKCALLTNNTHPYRFARDSCCKFDNKVACAAVSTNVMTSMDYHVGGGQGDALLEEEAGESHEPLLRLTEAQTTTTLPQLATLPPIQTPEPPTLPPMPKLPTAPTLAPPPTLPTLPPMPTLPTLPMPTAAPMPTFPPRPKLNAALVLP